MVLNLLTIAIEADRPHGAILRYRVIHTLVMLAFIPIGAIIYLCENK